MLFLRFENEYLAVSPFDANLAFSLARSSKTEHFLRFRIYLHLLIYLPNSDTAALAE